MSLNEKIAEALLRIRKIVQKNGANIVRSGQLLRQDRELLLRTKWLQKIIKGWYLVAKPDMAMGDSLTWYANFWDFLRVYLHYHFGNNYCLSAENSLDLISGSTEIPKQVVIITKKGGGAAQEFPFQTSCSIYADPKNLPEEKTKIKGLFTMSLPYALCKASPAYFRKNPREAQIALRLIRFSEEVSSILLKYNFKNAAARLLGGFEFLSMNEIAQSLQSDLSLFGWNIKPENPFICTGILVPSLRVSSPYVARIYSMWKEYREEISFLLPPSPGLPKNPKSYFDKLEEIYEKDAYNSLSIEGYQIDEALIERVQNNDWNPDDNPKDKLEKNALAARGYYEAFLEVTRSIRTLFKGETPGQVVERDLKKWYQKLFLPMVEVGIVRQEDLIGYRKSAVYIKNSRHIPLPKEALVDSMEALFECLKKESNAAIRAILGHYLFVYIHPYVDGNGRIGRFLMNVMFASEGYSWTIVPVKQRDQYLKTLELVTTDKTLVPFAKFILSCRR